MGKKHSYYGKSMSINFSDFPYTMGFVAFSCSVENWQGNPCISYIMTLVNFLLWGPLGMLLLHVLNFMWQVNCMPTLQPASVLSYPFANNLYATSWVKSSYSIQPNSYFSFLFLSNIKKMFYNFLITSSLIVFLRKIQKSYTSVDLPVYKITSRGLVMTTNNLPIYD